MDGQSTSLYSQAGRDTAACRAILAAATPDSQILRVVLHARPFDTVAVRMSPTYRELIGEGIKTHLHVPRPLNLTTYENDITGPNGKANDKLATLTLRATFGATLHRDGHLTNVSAIGGSASRAFGEAMVRAIQMLSDSSLLIPPAAPDVVFKGDSLALRFVVGPDLTSPVSKPVTRPPARGDTPLLLVRVPTRRATQSPSPEAGRQPPKYPASMRQARVAGKTVIEFVIDENGKADLSTIDVVQTPSTDFVAEILAVLPSHRFKPLLVDGCPVPVVVTEPFEFRLNPPP